MDGFADIHSHHLCGVDDGAKNPEEMLAIVDQAYRSGTRYLCATPHYHPGIFGENGEQSLRVFQVLKEALRNRYPDLRLTLGNELRYAPGAEAWLDRGSCRTMNGTDFVLVDFLQNESASKIVDALHRLMNAGYRPILAHAERYDCFGRDWKAISHIKDDGVLIQLDAASIFGQWDRHAKQMSRSLLKHQVADFVSSDAHDTDTRHANLSDAFEFVYEQHGPRYAEDLFFRNAVEELF